MDFSLKNLDNIIKSYTELWNFLHETLGKGIVSIKYTAIWALVENGLKHMETWTFMINPWNYKEVWNFRSNCLDSMETDAPYEHYKKYMEGLIHNETLLKDKGSGSKSHRSYTEILDRDLNFSHSWGNQSYMKLWSTQTSSVNIYVGVCTPSCCGSTKRAQPTYQVKAVAVYYREHDELYGVENVGVCTPICCGSTERAQPTYQVKAVAVYYREHDEVYGVENMDIYVNVGAEAPIYYKSTGNIETLGDHKHNSLEYGTAVFAGLWYGETKSRTSTAVFAGLGYCTNNTSYSLITDLHITYTKDEGPVF